MRILVAASSLALLAACSEPRPAANHADAANAAIVEEQASAGPTPAERNGFVGVRAPVADAPSEPANAATPTTPETTVSWVGRFAATPALCRGGVWNIQRERIVTDGETSCDVRGIEEKGAAVTLALACTAEGTESDERWTLTPGANEALAVERDTGREKIRVQLRRCG